ncbi:MAG: peptidoglycan-binding protein [Huintestinicola sp.]|uniref:peptidoglycan-binding domain-containing protein n=1 Tax=Huintestinicola sp. TaxID=2981661 RepID=UPI003F030C38
MANEAIPVSPQSHEANVTELQRYLREISTSGANVRPVIPDGLYNEQTAAAVADFQRMKGLPVTGETDRVTWDAILDTYYDIIANLSEQIGIKPLPSVKTVLSPGDKGTAIVIIQAMLNTLAGLFYNITPNSLSGVYDSDTVKAVAEFQTIAGLAPTGNTDIRTYNALAGLFDAVSAMEGEL